MKKKEVTVIQTEGKPKVGLTLVVDELKSVGQSFKRMEESLLTEDTIVTIIQRHCKPVNGKPISKETIREVLQKARNIAKLALKDEESK